MKIKTKKTMNLPQLIEYAWDNGIKGKTFYTRETGMENVHFNTLGRVEFSDVHQFSSDDYFTVEVEEEIDEYTVFHTLVKVIEDGTVYTCTDATINREKNSAVVEIHAILNGVLKLIWTHEKGIVE